MKATLHALQYVLYSFPYLFALILIWRMVRLQYRLEDAEKRLAKHQIILVRLQQNAHGHLDFTNVTKDGEDLTPKVKMTITTLSSLDHDEVREVIEEHLRKYLEDRIKEGDLS